MAHGVPARIAQSEAMDIDLAQAHGGLGLDTGSARAGARARPRFGWRSVAAAKRLGRPEQGAVWAQSLLLGVIIWLTQAAVYGSLAFAAAGAGGGWPASPARSC